MASLRDQITSKYSTPPASQGGASNLRQQIIGKYTSPPPSSGVNVRSQIKQKYNSPTAQNTNYSNEDLLHTLEGGQGPKIPQKKPNTPFPTPPPSELPTDVSQPSVSPFIQDGKLFYSKGSKTEKALNVLDSAAQLSDKFFGLVGTIMKPFTETATIAQKGVGAATTYGLQKLFPSKTDKSFSQLYQEAPTAADVINKGGDAALTLANREDIKNAHPITLTAKDLVHTLIKAFVPISFTTGPMGLAFSEGLNKIADKYGGDTKIIDAKPAYQLAQDLVKFVGDTSLDVAAGYGLGSAALKEGSVVKVSPAELKGYVSGATEYQGGKAIPQVAQDFFSQTTDKNIIKQAVKNGLEIRITQPTTNVGREVVGTLFGGSAPEGKTVEFLINGKKIGSTPLTQAVERQLISTKFNQTVDERASAIQAEHAVNPPTTDIQTFLKENGGRKQMVKASELSGPKVAVAVRAAQSPITPSLIDTIKQFTPQQGAAFGRKIVDQITEDLGLKVGSEGGGELQKTLSSISPQGTAVVRDTPSFDGRPAQVVNGKIELYMPNLKADLEKLAKGGTIAAHEGNYTTLYKMKEGESMEQLASRYVKDVLLHEQSHLQTMTAQDFQTLEAHRNNIAQAQSTGNMGAVNQAKTELENFQRTLEDKANAHMTSNRTQLETDLFGKSQSGVKGANRSFVDRVLGRTPEVGVTKTPSELLAEKLVTQEKLGKKIMKTQQSIQKKMESKLSKIKTVEEMKVQLRKFAKILPASERVKALPAIERVTNNNEAMRIVNKIRDLSQVAERNYARDQIVKELKNTKVKYKNGLPTNVKYDLSTQKTLDEVRTNLEKPYEQAQLEAIRLREEFQTANPNTPIPPELERKLDLLNMQGVDDMNAQELRKVLDNIKSLKSNGMTLKETERFNKQSYYQQVRDKYVDVITGGDHSLLSNESALPHLKLTESGWRSWLKKTYGALRDQYFRIVQPEEFFDYLSQLDKGSKPNESFLNRNVLRPAAKAHAAKTKGIIEQSSKMVDLINEVYHLSPEVTGIKNKVLEKTGIKKNDVLSKFQEMSTPVNLGEVRLLDGSTKKLELTKADAIGLYMYAQNPRHAGVFENAYKFGDDVMQKLDSFLTPEDKQLAEGVFKFFQEYYPSINTQFEKDYGFTLPQNPKYLPAFKDIQDTTPEDLSLLQEAHDSMKSAGNGSLKKTVENSLPFRETNIFQIMSRFITKMEHYKAFSDVVHEMNQTVLHKDFKQALRKVYGDKAVEILNRFGEDIARGGIDGAKIIPAVQKLITTTTRSFLWGNVNTAKKQLTGVMNYLIQGDLPMGTFLKGIQEYFTHPFRNDKFLREHSEYYAERYSSNEFQRDINTLMSSSDPLAKLKQGGVKKFINDLGFLPIKVADRITVGPGMWATMKNEYKRLTGKKFDVNNYNSAALNEAISKAEEVTQRVQEGSQIYQQSDLERSGSLGKALTMLNSQPNKVMQQVVSGGRNFSLGRGSKAYNIKKILYGGFIIPLIYLYVADKMKNEKYRDSKNVLLAKALASPFTSAAVVGNAIQSGVGWLTGETFDYNVSPAEQVMSDVKNTFTNLYSGLNGKNKTQKEQEARQRELDRSFTYFIDTLGRLKGLPTNIVTGRIRKNISASAQTNKK